MPEDLGKHLRPGPLLSVITVVLNQAEGLERTIQSVVEQDDDRIEYIVIDGGSGDEVLEVLRRHGDVIQHWRSEPDKGIYDAMNKGAACATGEWLVFINADDWLVPGVCTHLLDAASPDDAFLASAVRVFDRRNRLLGITRPLPLSATGLGRLQEMPFPHQGLYVRRYLFTRLGSFDAGLRVAADLDFVFRLLAHGVQGRVVDTVSANFTAHGASGGLLALRETMLVAIRHGRPPWLARLSLVSSLLKRGLVLSLPRILLQPLFRLRRSRHFLPEG